jgi:hypothetical protein
LIIDLLKDTACLPSYAKRYLRILIETPDDLVMFIDKYLYKNKNVMVSVAEFRSFKFENRNYSFEDFQKDFEHHRTKAIEKLFLHPHSRTNERVLIIPLLKRKFTLRQVYDFQKENPMLNSVLAGKILSQLP